MDGEQFGLIKKVVKTLYITVFKVCVLTFMFKMNREPFQVQVNSPVCVSCDVFYSIC